MDTMPLNLNMRYVTYGARTCMQALIIRSNPELTAIING